jgi:hypothetical protein
LSDQKYRQHGYRDSDRDKSAKTQSERSGEPQPKRVDTFGPRKLQMAGNRSVSRCAQCGAVLPPPDDRPELCPKCSCALHSCRQCTYFDTSKRFECMQPIPVRIPRKDERNDCTFYSMSVRMEKETSTPIAAKAPDARQAFENLFKK